MREHDEVRAIITLLVFIAIILGAALLFPGRVTRIPEEFCSAMGECAEH